MGWPTAWTHSAGRSGCRAAAAAGRSSTPRRRFPRTAAINRPQGVGSPIVWRLSLATSPERVFELLDTDEGRERFWAVRSRAVSDGFELEFPGGLTGRAEVLDRQAPRRLTIRYFGSEAELELARREDGGCLFQVTCHCDDPAAWMELYPGWVSWLLVLKAAVDFDVDLRNGSPERAWEQGYVDQ